MATSTGPNGNVHYVEPNFVYDFTEETSTDNNKHEQAPDLGDYCIALDMEVEISGRNSEVSQTLDSKKVIIMSWKQDTKGSTIGFLEGTKIYKNIEDRPSLSEMKNGNYGKVGSYINSLTTNYTDIFYTDLKDYGTTEMFGIESVDIQYNNFMVPEVTIRFVDIRGVSLFAPTEMRFDKALNGIQGMSQDNIASSFFQCFFTFPYPRFSILVKGFYGKPVCYELTCSDFRANFRADTGNFEATAKFIGYAYSFLNDVSVNALLAAPFAKPLGSTYWEEAATEGGRFAITDKDGNTVKMPTLISIVKDVASIFKKAEKIAADDPAVQESQNVQKQKDAVNEIADAYQSWFDAVKSPYVGQGYSNYRYHEMSKNGAMYGYIMLVGKDIVKPIGIYNKTQLDALDAAYKKIDEGKDKVTELYGWSSINLPSKISDLALKQIFKVTNAGIVLSDEMLKEEPKVQEYAKDWLKEFNETSKKKEIDSAVGSMKREDSYIYGFISSKDTSFWNRELERLDNNEESLKDEVNAAQEQAVTTALGFSPSIENITRIIMAHFETLMHMMFQTSKDIQAQKRTPESLGVTNADLSDVPQGVKEVPPFPRVVINTITSSGVTKKEDAWVGSFNGSTKFLEEDLVNSLFDAIDIISTIFKLSDENANSDWSNEEATETSAVMEIPLTPFDLFMNGNPYGGDKNVALSLSSFAGNICTRMMTVLDLNAFSRGTYMSQTNITDTAKTLGTVEAINFSTFFSAISPKIVKCLSGGEDNMALTSDVLLDIVTNKKDDIISSYKEGNHWPWDGKSSESTALLTKSGNDLVFERFKSNNTVAYPINKSVEEMEELAGSSYKTNEGVAYRYIGGTNVQNDIYAYHIFDNWKNVKTIIDTQVKGHTNDVDGLGNYCRTFDNFYYKPTGKYSMIELINCKETVYEQPCVLKPKISAFFNTQKIKVSDQAANSRYMPSTKARFLAVSGDVFNGGDDFFKQAKSGTVYRIAGYKGGDCNENSYKEFIGTPDDGPQTGNYVLTEFLGFDENGNIDGRKSLFAQKEYYNLPSEELKAFMFLQSISTSINISKNIQYFKNQYATVVPNLFVLLVGAYVSSIRHSDKFNSRYFNDKKSFEIRDFINGDLSPMARNQFEARFNTFVSSSFWGKIKSAYELGKKSNVESFLNSFRGNIDGSGIDSKFKNLPNEFFMNYMSVSKTRAGASLRLANRENSSIMKDLVSEMFKPMVCCLGTKFGKKLLGEYDTQVKVPYSQAKNYLDAFLKKLKELLNGDGGDDENGGGGVSLANSPKGTTDDMKVGLYNYLKLLYDKWIPASTEDEWKMEKYFEKENGDRGHSIHFIDSYYNVIGQDIYLNIGSMVNQIRSCFQYNNNVWSSMLMFMSGLYADAKCLFLSIQNFMDLNDINNMKSMFDLVPYNNIHNVKRHPDFVVLYPYQPSEKLDNGSSFENDGFMLNRSDELANLPEALTTRTDNTGQQGYYLPAFGVSYGKQYQSVFSNIDVGMEAPMVTEQSLKAKMVIAMQGAGEDKSGNSKGLVTAGQDLYSIYSSNSYTCTVTMMGCAWVQPIMYFVLLNIPMFRGSYLIVKVSHHLEQGNMTTTFTGIRMANVSTRSLKNPLYITDSNNNGSNADELLAAQHKAADIDNDCPYEVFSPLGGDGLGPSFASELSKPIEQCKNVGKNVVSWMKQHGYNTVLDALTFGCLHEMYVYRDELATALVATIEYNMVCFGKNWKNLMSDKHPAEFVVSGVPNKQYPPLLNSLPKVGSSEYNKHKEVVRQVFTNSPSWILNKWNKTPNGNTINLGILQKIYQTELTKAKENKTDFSGKTILTYTNKNYSEIVLFRNTNGDCWQAKPPSTPNNANKKEEFAKGFLSALQSSMNSNDNIKVDIDGKIKDSNITITQKNGKTDKLAKVFDVIINGYMEYVQTLSWRGSDKTNPNSIYVTVAQNVNVASQLIYHAAITGSKTNVQDGTCWGENAIKSFIKKFGSDKVIREENAKDNDFTKTVPQCAKMYKNTKIEGKNALGEITVKSCSEIVSIGGPYGSGGTIDVNKKIGNWDVGKSIKHIIGKAIPSWRDCNGKCGNCWAYVKRALMADGFTNDGSVSAFEAAKFCKNKGFVQIASGKNKAHSGVNLTAPQAGDILVWSKAPGHQHGHVAMYTGSKWVCDFVQDGPWVGSDYDGTWTCWRYGGSGKS